MLRDIVDEPVLIDQVLEGTVVELEMAYDVLPDEGPHGVLEV